jgi:hypothetical protein
MVGTKKSKKFSYLPFAPERKKIDLLGCMLSSLIGCMKILLFELELSMGFPLLRTIAPFQVWHLNVE